MTTNCCISRGIAVRASVDNCAACMEPAAAIANTGIENFKRFLNKFFLQDCGPFSNRSGESPVVLSLPFPAPEKARSFSLIILNAWYFSTNQAGKLARHVFPGQTKGVARRRS